MNELTARLDVYISAYLYEHLRLGKPLDKAKAEYYVYECRLVRFSRREHEEETRTYIDQLKAIHPNERIDFMPEIYKFEEDDFLARYNLCKDFIAAYQSLKGII